MSSSSALPNLTSASNSNSATSAASSANTGSSGGSKATSSQSGSQSVSSATGLPTIGASSSSISSLSNAPSLTSSDAAFSLTGLPTLSGVVSYPPASVPPTQNAPYMATSYLPQNFVFILVGGVLGLILLMVTMWRFLTAWSINRSFKRDAAAMYTPIPDVKKKPVRQESGMDMADLSAKLPKSFNSVPNLFFSPTAEAARHSMIRPQSQHMPGGHYRDVSKG